MAGRGMNLERASFPEAMATVLSNQIDMSVPRVVFIIGSPVHNKGSEAIVRGFVEICRRMPAMPWITLSAVEPSFGPWLDIPGIRTYQLRPGFGAPGRFLETWLRKVQGKLEGSLYAPPVRWLYQNLLAEVARADLVVFVGADNYAAAYGCQRTFHEFNAMVRSAVRGRMLLYDCSLEESDLDAETRANFLLFDAVTARECVTHEHFRRSLDGGRVHYYPDPAFAMPAEPIPLPPGWQAGNMVGVNLSNLVAQAQYGSGRAGVVEAYHALIEHVLKNTGFHVALIPHVMNNADLSMLRPLHERFKGTGRVLLIEDETLRAPQLKHLISQCRLYVGARTHSTIAAYSSRVPTLVLGYSVKSIGIARDLFGTEKDLVVSVQDLKSNDEIAKAFQRLCEREDEIRARLSAVMPAYIEKALSTHELIERLIEDPHAPLGR